MLSAVITADHRYPALQLAPQPGHERIVRLGPLVLESAPLNSPTPTTDTDRTVSRRSEPSSCTTLTGEQPDPWDLLQPQDVISRHRGAKPRRRCELSGAISLLSPAYLLSVERWPVHTGPPDHLGRLSSQLETSLSLSRALLPMRSHRDYACYAGVQWQAVVKVHGVFLSSCGKSESAPILQFRRACGGDSRQVVTPFMQAGTYPTSNFATLRPSYLRTQ